MSVLRESAEQLIVEVKKVERTIELGAIEQQAEASVEISDLNKDIMQFMEVAMLHDLSSSE